VSPDEQDLTAEWRLGQGRYEWDPCAGDTNRVFSNGERRPGVNDQWFFQEMGSICLFPSHRDQLEFVSYVASREIVFFFHTAQQSWTMINANSKRNNTGNETTERAMGTMFVSSKQRRSSCYNDVPWFVSFYNNIAYSVRSINISNLP
jgi:hypothetical protein